MSKNWKDKGWNNMVSMLDEAMPVQRRPLLTPFPIQVRIATLVLIIIGSAYWGFNLMNSGNDLNKLQAFDFIPTQEISNVEVKPEVLEAADEIISNNQSTQAAIPVAKKGNNFSSNSLSSTNPNSKLPQAAPSGIIENLNEADIVYVSEESPIAQVSAVSSLEEESNLVDNKSPESSEINISNQLSVENEVHSTENESIVAKDKTLKPEMLQLETAPITNPKLNTTFSIGASAGNYSFSSPNLYGQLQLNVHVPITKSFHLTVFTAAGRGLLYENTEVLLAEFSNSSSNGTILGSEAPGDDLSAYIDIKSLSNALIGSQIQWQISKKWSLGLGAGAAYLFNIQHQAIQSTSLVPEGQSPQQIFTASEITEKFAHWNHWDLRMNASLQYNMTNNWSMAMSYNRGFANLLKHPISSEHNIQMNSLTLGLNFRFK